MENAPKKIILVPHCFMTKRFAIHNRRETEEVLKVLLKSQTGILQMPCPHLVSLMNKKNNGNLCDSKLIKDIKQDSEDFYLNIINMLLIKIERYQELNFEINGLIGIKGSPVCGIYNPIVKEHGSFTILLNKELKRRGIQLRIGVI